MEKFILNSKTGLFYMYLTELPDNNEDRYRAVFPVFDSTRKALIFKQKILSKMKPVCKMDIKDNNIHLKIEKGEKIYNTDYFPQPISIDEFMNITFIKLDASFLLVDEIYESNSFLNVQGMYIDPKYEQTFENYDVIISNYLDNLYKLES